MSEPPRSIIFLHIPKAAGTTLRSVLERQYEDNELHCVSVNPSLQESIRQFRNLPSEKRDRIRCLYGHGTYGLHEKLCGRTEYITILREPVERVISNYYFIIRSTGHWLYETVTSQQMSLREYVKSGVNPNSENGMVRSISRESDPGKSSLHKSKKRIQNRFGVVGTVENFEESVILMKKRYGWENVGYRVQNSTSSRPAKHEIPEDVRRLIESKNRLDLELYDFAQSRLEKDLGAVANLESELRRLRLQNVTLTASATIRKALKKPLNMIRSLIKIS